MSSNDSEKIVPPKKSKAARKTEEKKEEAASNHDGEDTVKAKESESDKNIFNEEPIVEGKRKRNNPASEQFAKEWLQKHLVEAELSLILFTSDIYKCYVESCTSNGGISLLEGEFVKVLHSIFPKGYALAPGCPYKDAIRKKKVQKNTPKVVQAESLQLKMKDIIIDSIMSLGNPRRGVSMNAMKNFVSGKHPALRLDQREGNFKKVISNLLRFKKIDCVRGIGACGFYRMPRTPEEEEAEIAKEKQEAKEKLKKKKEKQVALKRKQEEKEGKTEEEGDGDKVMEVDVDDVTEDGKGDKREQGEERGDGDAGVNEASGQPTGDEEGVNQVEKEGDAKKDKNKKKKKKVKKPSSSSSREFLDFENPSKIEDTFPLAMTYNCEPKEASIVKITKYVTDFYQQDLSNKEKLKKCLEAGMEKGYWTQVTGTSSGSGTYRLTIEEFDPNADSDLTGMIMNAIVACTEPKISSASLLKKYIQEYHPGLKVVEQPRKFKQALLRAISTNKIKQLSGIGATGSFQLLETFRPSPSILQGKNSTSWPSSGDGEDDEEDIGGTDVEDGGLELYQDAYKPRPSKRRGMGRAVETTKVSRLDLSSYPSLKKLKANGSSNGINSRRSATQGRGRASSIPKKSVKRPAPQEDEEEEEEEEEEESDDEKDDSEPEYEPKKSRGGRSVVGRGGKKSVAKKNQQMAAPKPVKASKTSKTSGASPKTKKAKLSKASLPEKLEARAAKRRVSYAEAEDDNDEDEEDEDDKEEDNKTLNMASSPKKGAAAQKKQPRTQPPRNQRSSTSSIQQVSIILDRELENQLPSVQKNSGKSARPAKTEASLAVANGGSKSSPRKGKKGFKGKKKLRGKH